MAEVESTRDGAVQTITLNRPDKMNAFTRALHAALKEALKDARDPEVRAVVVTGAGRGFCAGQDLTEFGEAGGVGMTKRLFDHADTATLEEQLEHEAQLQAAATQTDDFREGVAAFLEKREPRFSGR